MSLMDRVSRRKFHNDKLANGESLIWPGTPEGFPLRGKVIPHLKQEEYENLPLRFDFDCDWFDINDDDSRTKYKQVMDRIASGVYYLWKRHDLPDPATGKLRIWLEWLVITGELPNRGASNGV